jgi:peptidoglycan/LPS O-acetylase OafA/YrhL
MFGFYRTLLALMVVFQHLGGIKTLGGYAVFGFYILSGYLMTLILHVSYKYSMTGFGKYALNRFLRIYPIYWVSCLISVVIVLWLGPSYTTRYHNSIFLPDALTSMLQNIFITFTPKTLPRLLPPAWALTVELFFYICIGIGMSKTKRLTIVWFSLSIVYTVIINLMGLDRVYKYYIIPAASLPFSTGALLYHYKDKIIKVIPFLRSWVMPAILFILVLFNYLVSYKLDILETIGFYINYLLQALIVASLIDRPLLPFVSRQMDKLLGDFSYPIYLIHFQGGLILLGMGIGLKRGELLFAVVSLPVIFFLSWCLTRFIEQPIENIRKKVKTMKRFHPTSESSR